MVGIPFALRLAPTTAFVVPLVAKNKDNICVPIGGTVAHQMNKTHARLRSQSIGHR